MAHRTTVVDLDAKLAEAGIEDEPIHTKTIHLFGRDWTMVCDLNTFNLASMMEGDGAAVLSFVEDVIHPDELAEFKLALSKAKGLSGPKLGALIGLMVEAASERPTTRPSVSSRGATKRTSKPRSAAASSRPGVRSVR